MSPNEREVKRKLRILNHAEDSGNIKTRDMPYF